MSERLWSMRKITKSLGSAGSVKITDYSDDVLRALVMIKKSILEDMGQRAQKHAKDYETAVDTGRLRNSITHKVSGDAVYIGTNVQYARYIEFGTSRGIKGIHYLEKSVKNHTEEYSTVIKNALDDLQVLDKAGELKSYLK